MTGLPGSPERWLPVPGWGARYEVSDAGRVRNRKTFRVLKPGRTRSGHLHVTLSSGKARRLLQVHHLVLGAFVGPRPAGLFGLHHDDNPRNNRLGNLRWGTRSENWRDAVRNGRDVKPPVRRGEAASHAKLTAEKIGRAKRLRKQGLSYARIGKLFGVGRKTIENAIKGKTWAHLKETPNAGRANDRGSEPRDLPQSP